jgi:23S rRNA pseudouridine1911/1915/1917 synthase
MVRASFTGCDIIILHIDHKLQYKSRKFWEKAQFSRSSGETKNMGAIFEVSLNMRALLWYNQAMDILYIDNSIIVCVKPAGVLSTDEEGGMPSLLRRELGTQDVRTVHRLDRVVSGLMVFARSAAAASELSRKIREGEFDKQYLAVIHWRPPQEEGTMRDLLWRDPAQRKTLVVKQPGKGVQEAVLEYELLCAKQGLSKVQIKLITGRTHQIRAQFSSRGLPLVGDKKYSRYPDDCGIALWSRRLHFRHPDTGETLDFSKEPPQEYPWTIFDADTGE